MVFLSFYLKSQIEIIDKNMLSFNLSIKSPVDQLIINPCSYYKLKKNKTIQFYRNLKIIGDTALIYPLYDLDKVKNLMNELNFLPLNIEQNKVLSIKLSFFSKKRKIKNKIIKLGYYTLDNNNQIHLKYAIYQD